MNSREEQLAQRRQDLRVRCALQRQQLLVLEAQVERRLVTADRLINVAAILTRKPAFLVAGLAGLAGLAFAGPWRLIRWTTQGAVLVKIALQLRSWLRP